MAGFGIIIIDDDKKKLYGTSNHECFKAAKYLKLGLVSATSVVALSLY